MPRALRVSRKHFYRRVLRTGNHVAVGPEHGHIYELAEEPLDHRGVGGWHEKLDLLARLLGHPVCHGLVELQLSDGFLRRNHGKGQRVRIFAFSRLDLKSKAGCNQECCSNCASALQQR